MKICIIFRGENVRPNVHLDKNVENWKTTIFNNIINNNYDPYITFITYDSNMLDYLKKEINPNEVILYPYRNNDDGQSQIYNFEKVNDYIQINKNKFDRFVILRFDIIYNINITRWNCWTETGIILPSKDITWNSTLLYNDLVFIIDKDYDIFNEAVKYMMNLNNIPKHMRYSHHDSTPHNIGQYLFLKSYNIILMYNETLDGIYNHPLYKFSKTITY
jgi:hypothetical protein